MATPAYVTAGTGYGNATLAASHSVARPAAVTPGNYLVAVIQATNTNGNAAATVTTSNWVQFTGSPFAGTNNRLILYGKIAEAGVDDAGGTITVVGTGGATADGLHARIFEFSSATGWDASPVQGIGSAVSGTTTTGAISCPSVTTPVDECLAVLAMVLNDDAGNTASATGETGGNWTQAVAEFESTAGSGGTIELQTAAMATAGTLSGGTIAYGASGDNYVAVAFALVPFSGPIITSIDTDNDTTDTRTSVVIAGSQFGASETGSAKVEISNNATYASGTIVEIDATAWSATSVTVTLRRESDSAALAGLFTLPLSPAYLWVTNSAGTRNPAGFQFTLRAPGPTPVAALNENVTLDVDTTYLIRVRVENSGGIGATAFRWSYNHNSGGWNPVTTSSTAVKAVAATAFVNDDDVPEVLTGSGTYASNNDAASEDGTSTLPASFPASGAIEFVLAFQLVSADVTDAQTGQIRLELNDGTDLDTYTNTFTYTVEEAAAGTTVTLDTKALFPIAGENVLASVAPVLDTRNLALAGFDLSANLAAILDTAAKTPLAGADLSAAVQPVLDTKALSPLAGTDVLVSIAPALDTKDDLAVAGTDVTPLLTVTLDTAAKTPLAGTDIAAAVVTTLDTAALSPLVGTDLLASTAVTPDSATVAVTATDIVVLPPTSITLDTGNLAIAGTDVLAAVVAPLDTAALSPLAGTELLPNLSIAIASANVPLAGADLAILTASTIALDAAALSPLAGSDLTILEARTLTLDSGTVAGAGNDVSPDLAITLDTRALAPLAGSDLLLVTAPLLDSGNVALTGADLLAAVVAPLDSAALTPLASADLIILEARTITLDQRSLAPLVGTDILASVAPPLDTAALTPLAGSDIPAALSAPLDTGGALVSGTDVGIQQAGAVILDSGTITVTGTEIPGLSASIIVLDSGAIAAAGADLSPDLTVTLDSGGIATAGADISAALIIGLDSTALTPLAGTDLGIQQAGAVILDSGNIAAAGSDLSAPLIAALDQGTIAGLANLSPDLTIALDTDSIAVAGQDLNALTSGAVGIDQGAITVTGEDIAAHLVAPLDTRALTLFSGTNIDLLVTADLDSAALAPLAGNDLTILAPFALVLDSANISVTGNDVATAIPGTVVLDTRALAPLAGTDLDPALAVELETGAIELEGADTAFPAVALLDSGNVQAAGNDLERDLALPLDQGSIVVLADELTISLRIVLDFGTVQVAGADINVIAGEIGEFGEGQEFLCAFSTGQVFAGLPFSTGQTFADIAFDDTSGGQAFTCSFGSSNQSFGLTFSTGNAYSAAA